MTRYIFHHESFVWYKVNFNKPHKINYVFKFSGIYSVVSDPGITDCQGGGK